MDFLQKAPDWLVKAVPEGGARDFVQGAGWYVVLGVGGLVILFILWCLVRAFRSKGYKPSTNQPHLEEALSEYPPLKPSTGDRQLRAEGVPVRMRLVVVAPAGKDGEVSADDVEAMLERVLPGLGEIFRGDKPRIKVWPRQLSYEGFTKHFQRNMLTLEGEGEMSPWILLGGRAKLGTQQIMLGLALQAAKPTTVGRRTLEAHEWPTVLRVRVKD
ncbi:MAG TPA: hypothetical protein VNX28_02135 [Gemmataceae bacterium]|jgi:hypothetical protein|nr:hypothetical protein [Gemmataceae bacterium]